MGINKKYLVFYLIAGIVQFFIIGYVLLLLFGLFTSLKYLYITLPLFIFSILPLIIIILSVIYKKKYPKLINYLLITLVLHTIIVFIFLGDFVPSSKGSVRDSYTNTPIKNLQVCYGISGGYAFAIGHGMDVTVKRGCTTTNKEGEFRIPFYMGFTPFVMVDELWINYNDGNYELVNIKRYKIGFNKFSKGSYPKDLNLDLQPKIKSIEECKQISDQNKKQECYNKYAVQNAASTNNTLICNLVPDKIYDCLTTIALNKIDYTICNNLKKDVDSENCIFEIAKKEQNYGKCKELKIVKEKCEEHFYCGEKDSICFSSYGKSIREKINFIVDNDNIKLCNELPNLPKQFCYFEFAIKNLNSNYCEILNYTWKEGAPYDEDLQSQCYLSLAIYTKNEKLCDKVLPKSKIQCVNQILIEKGILNIIKKVNMRVESGRSGPPPNSDIINDGNIYVNASDYACYSPGVVIPGTYCRSFS